MAFLWTIAIWFIAGLQSLNASDCSYFQMNQAGGSMYKSPVPDQGKQHLCYAYTATQIIDAIRSNDSQKDFRHISVLEAVLGSKQKNENETSPDRGKTCAVIDHISLHGACADDEVMSVFKKSDTSV